MNLRFKFLLFVSLIIIFIFTVVTIVLTIVLAHSVQDELVSKDKILAERINPDLTTNLGDYYTYDFNLYATSIKSLFHTYPDLLHFRIFNPDGQTVIDSSEILQGKKQKIAYPKADQQTLSLIASQKKIQDFSQYNGQKTIRTFTPFIDNYGIYRLMVEYDFSLESGDTAIREIVGLLLLLGLVSILVGIGLTYLLVTRVTKPIKSLIIGAGEMSKGNLNYPIATTNSHDEIGQLSQTFSIMAKKLSLSYQGLEEQVRQRTDELEKAKTGLEEQVKQRTAALEVAKRDLESEVTKRTQELEKKVTELERINKLMLNRELKMMELKKEIEKLKMQIPSLTSPKE